MSCDQIFPNIPIIKTARAVKKIWRIVNITVSIFYDNIIGYLSLDIIYSLKLTVFLKLHVCSRKTACFLSRTDNVCGQISQRTFVPNGGYCLYQFRLCFEQYLLIYTPYILFHFTHLIAVKPHLTYIYSFKMWTTLSSLSVLVAPWDA